MLEFRSGTAVGHYRLTFMLLRHLLIATVPFVAVHGFAQSPADWPAPRKIDLERAAAVGIREISSRHLRLVTDVPASPAVDELPMVFDAAIPLWTEYFHISRDKLEGWKVQAFLIQDRAKFAALELLPEQNLDYVNGYALGNEFWFDEQPSDYYRRHLLLHEGTHSFMLAFLGAGGPGWYMEGMAELFGTHRWHDSQLELRIIPENREAVPMWGRIKLIREADKSGKERSLDEVLAISNRQALEVDAYAWCWALSKFLDSHPRYGDKFRELPAQVKQPEFNARFRKLYHQQWSGMQFEWQAFLAALDYGYDARRMAVRHSKVQLLDTKASTTIAVDHGWQQAPWMLRKGQTYLLTSAGRYEIANDDGRWPCEPGGVTLRYHDGHPLGMLIGELRTKKKAGEFSRPLALGLQATFTPDDDAVLYLRVNDSPAELSENRGTLEVRIEPVSSGD